MKLTVPSVGRIVHYILTSNGEHRPAIVVRSAKDGNVDLCVFMPESVSSQPQADIFFCVEPWPVPSARESSAWSPDEIPDPPPNTWHWPEYVPDVEIEIPDETEKEE